MTILAIDQGTSATKALVHDGEKVLAVVEHPVHPRYMDAGGVEVDPNELLATVVAAGTEALSAAGTPALSMICLANQGETVLAWDPESGAPLSPALVWQDRRAEEICLEMRGEAPRIAARTGLVLDSYFSAPKMAWLRRHVTKTGVVTTTDTWLVHQLTGEFVTDIATASRSLLLDVDTAMWDAELIELFGLGEERFPALVDNDGVVGSTRAFGSEAPVGGLIVDQQAALAAQRCLQPGDAKCTYGTGGFLLANSGSAPVRSAHRLTSSVAWSLSSDRTYCLDAQAYTLGSAIAWLASTGVLSATQNIDSEAASESAGVTFVPALAGMAAPWWSATPGGALLGMSLASDAGHIIRAVLEGLACQITVLARQVSEEVGTPLTRLRVDGGLTRSAELMQAQADLLQIPVECYPSPHATALGAIAMGRLASGQSHTIEAAVPQREPRLTYEPRWAPERAAETVAAWEACVRLVVGREGST